MLQDANNIIHETFEIETKPQIKKLRSQVVRQDRYEVKNVDCKLILGAKHYEVLDYSTFGVAVFSEEDHKILSNYPEVPFILEGIEIARLHLVRVRTQPLQAGFKTAFEIIGEPLSLVRVNAVLESTQAVNVHKNQIDTVLGVPESFRRKVYEIKDCLENLQDLVRAMQESQKFESNQDIHVFETTTADVISRHLNHIFQPAYLELAATLVGVTDEERKASLEFFRDKLRHLIHQSALAERFYEKPLGYAGDHAMMSFIYRNEDHGKGLFAKCLHRYFMKHPFGKAVRNRADFLKAKITSKVFPKATSKKILSVASGPAKEIELVLSSAVDLTEVEFHLLDQDITALREAQRNIRTMSRTLGKEINVKYLHKAIRNIFKNEIDEKYDLIYSAGLFDYFSETVARGAAKKLYDLLLPGGELVIGNFTASDESKALMELAFDWHLIYRTERELVQLYEGIAPKLLLEAEPESVNLFVVLKKD